MNNETYIGRGLCGKIYKIDDNPPLARKEFDPVLQVKVLHRLLYGSAHFLDTQDGYSYSFWKRRLANRLARYFSSKYPISSAYIVDATEPSEKGFISEFIEGRNPQLNDMRYMHDTLSPMREFFISNGVPGISLAVWHPLSLSNIVVREGKIFVLDFEEAMPYIDKSCLTYDLIYHDKIEGLLRGKDQDLRNELGSEEFRNLTEAAAISRQYQDKLGLRPINLKFWNGSNGRTYHSRSSPLH